MKAIILNELKETLFETSVEAFAPNIQGRKFLYQELRFVSEKEKINSGEYVEKTYVPVAIIYEELKK